MTPCWQIGGGRVLRRGRLPLLMGIVNVTPDSFSDGGEFLATEAAVEHALRLVEDGADVVDIGGESTRPGAAPVDADEELRRTIPVVARLAQQCKIPVSIDTRTAAVARAAIDAGAAIVNDVSGLTHDPGMMAVCRAGDAGVCLMHMRGTPETMQDDPHYADVVLDVTCWLETRRDACAAAGIDFDRICLDPGIGFGKTAAHNLALMGSVSRMRNQLRRPLLIGHSRKRFLASLLGRPVEERLAGTVGVSIALAQGQADILRIHDVRAVKDSLTAWDAVVSADRAGTGSFLGR